MNETIALYSPDMRGGGAERVTLNLVQELVTRGVSVDLVLARAVGQYLSEVPETVRLIDLASWGKVGSLPGLVKYFRDEKPMAMLSTQMHANIIALIARRMAKSSARMVVREANIIALPSGGLIRAKARSVLSLARICYPWADDVVAVSEGVAHSLHEDIDVPYQTIRVIYNPVVRPELRKHAEGLIEHPWFESNDLPIVLGVGRLEEQKDFSTLIRSFAIVRRKIPSRLVIFGEGNQRNDLERIARALGLDAYVSLPGFTNNPYAYMSRASAYVLSSAWEGWPDSLIEAMALGVPVVATDCDCGPREILADGVYGHLAKVGDVDGLAQGILSALTNEAYPRATDHALQQFDIDRSIDSYLRVLRGEVKVA